MTRGAPPRPPVDAGRALGASTAAAPDLELELELELELLSSKHLFEHHRRLAKALALRMQLISLFIRGTTTAKIYTNGSSFVLLLTTPGLRGWIETIDQGSDHHAFRVVIHKVPGFQGIASPVGRPGRAPRTGAEGRHREGSGNGAHDLSTAVGFNMPLKRFGGVVVLPQFLKNGTTRWPIANNIVPSTRKDESLHMLSPRMNHCPRMTGIPWSVMDHSLWS
jgi:hypothetical protein